ncbi:uncharacterized protein LOC126904268 isoform X3 [Daktulosphaira vitifoliae]|uniref:uncharacterized protein LOC126904268 isoform X3 n=1 Tax=Daktulosphaira vitifoliae TaxID=58002 RepID=UPI0021AABB96|nr:uncharacterized protein LOC126904268 isoform X3 [Daktulosphaira vitifoliae]
MFLLNIFGILWLSHNIILITAIPKNNWFSKIFLNNTSKSSESKSKVVHITEMKLEEGNWCSYGIHIEADYRFQPVDSKWRREISKKLKFQTEKPHKIIELNKMLSTPKSTQCLNVTLDNNQFFRIISVLFTGTQKNDKKLRKKVENNLKNENYITKIFEDEDSKNIYAASYSPEKLLDTVLILITSYVIETSIYIFIKEDRKWYYFPKNISIDESTISQEKSIYLYDMDEQFLIITDVFDK